MFSSQFKQAAAIFILLGVSTALQVSPSSPCSNVCIDNINDDPTNTRNSNTNGADLSCDDADYTNTDKGIKFQKCMTCLQTSNYASGSENDQSWFIYNLRYTVDWCFFGFPSNPTPLSGPCTTEASCGLLSTALETGGLNPSNGSTYDYCLEDGGMFLHAFDHCSTCIQQMSGTHYLSNFLIALQAGCQQKPSGDLVIGLDNSVFSSSVINITSAALPTTSTTPTPGLVLTTGAIAGIAVGITVLILIALAIAFVCYRKRRVRTPLSTKYHPRFGASEITAPNQGAFTNPNYAPRDPSAPLPWDVTTSPPLPKERSMSSNSDYTSSIEKAKRGSLAPSEITIFDGEACLSPVLPEPSPVPSVGAMFRAQQQQSQIQAQQAAQIQRAASAPPPRSFTPPVDPNSFQFPFTASQQSPPIKYVPVPLPVHAAYNPATFRPEPKPEIIPKQPASPPISMHARSQSAHHLHLARNPSIRNAILPRTHSASPSFSMPLGPPNVPSALDLRPYLSGTNSGAIKSTTIISHNPSSFSPRNIPLPPSAHNSPQPLCSSNSVSSMRSQHISPNGLPLPSADNIPVPGPRPRGLTLQQILKLPTKVPPPPPRRDAPGGPDAGPNANVGSGESKVGGIALMVPTIRLPKGRKNITKANSPDSVVSVEQWPGSM